LVAIRGRNLLYKLLVSNENLIKFISEAIEGGLVDARVFYVAALKVNNSSEKCCNSTQSVFR